MNIEDLQFVEFIRRKHAPKKKIDPITIGPLYMDYNSKWITLNGKLVPMHLKSFELLWAIFKRKGEWVSHYQLMKEVFPEKKYSRFTSWVGATVYYIRKRLGQDVIISENGKGYKINVNYVGRIETKSIQAA